MASHASPRTAHRPSPWATPFARRTYLSATLWAAGVVVAIATSAPDAPGWLAIRLDVGGLLLTGAALIGGVNFFGAGLRAIRTLRLDMNFLMSVAILAAILIGEPFEAASLAFLFSTAELLERYAVDRGRRSIASLLELAPEQADRLTDAGDVETVSVDQLAVGDVVRVRPGDKIPADGRAVAGVSEVNEATITGESLPRTKGPGDLVSAGTLNLNGSLDIEVLADAAHSTIARIVQLVREAEGRRAPIEHAVKRFALVYTPIVTALAILVMVGPPLLLGEPGMEWFTRGLTLLVIACPCALVIATPVTVVSALTSAARHGVLIKGGEHLEALGAARALAIDKTGTLTTGQLAVTGFEAVDLEQQRLLALVAGLETRSEHPVARAILRYAADRGVRPVEPVQSFRSTPGRGVQGVVDGISLAVGSEEQVPPDTALGWGEPETGTLRIYAHAGDSGRGLFVLRDELRPAIPRTVTRLHGLGVRPIVMLTGDTAAAADIVARAAGIDEAQSRLLPEEKVAAVRELKRRFNRVAMLGDGVNDAPALAEATVGIAMGVAGSPAAIEAADVALMGDDLTRLPYVIHLARRARRTIRFNIALALGLKLLLAVGAVGGVVSLAVAVLVGDLGASLVVTANALSLARIRPKG